MTGLACRTRAEVREAALHDQPRQEAGTDDMWRDRAANSERKSA